MSYLSQHMNRMRNDELIGLAKNRFLDEEDQLTLAKHPYRRAKMYLCDNPVLHPATIDYIWNLNGYAFKTDLLKNGHCMDNPSKYYELYNSYGKNWARSRWRFQQAFIYSYWTIAGEAGRGANATPSDLLNKIYDSEYLPTEDPMWHGHYALKHLADHPNCDLPLAIKLSQHSNGEVSRMGFKKIVALSKK